MNKMDRCEICNEDSSDAGKLQRLYTKGYENLIKQCRRIRDSSLLERLETKWTSNIPITVHRRCRALFMQKESQVEEQEHTPRKKRRVSQLVNDCTNKGKRKLFILIHMYSLIKHLHMLYLLEDFNVVCC